jgi:hypothetical protein
MKNKRPPSLAILVYGEPDSGRNALTEEKYRELANAFSVQGFVPHSVLYCDEQYSSVLNQLQEFDAILVWINPIEQGKDRRQLDKLLKEIASKGSLVSAHPDVILKMGTKDVLYKTRKMDWGGDIKLYKNQEEFLHQFPASILKSGARVLKQYRGNGGNGVFKIEIQQKEKLRITHAVAGTEPTILTFPEFFKSFEQYFLNEGMLIDQEWNKNMSNGMVRCYCSGTSVAGFGYQEINAMYESNKGKPHQATPPSKRYYFTENCGLFRDLKIIMETKWIPELQEILTIDEDQLPVIWDADFFINDPGNPIVIGKYTLCEINVSSVSPFPPSAVKHIVEEVSKRIHSKIA